MSDEMPEVGWVSDNDTSLIFDSHHEAKMIAHGNLTKYVRSDLAGLFLVKADL